MATTTARPQRGSAGRRSASRQSTGNGDSAPTTEPTKDRTKPRSAPGKARKPQAARAAGRPKKAVKPPPARKSSTKGHSSTSKAAGGSPGEAVAKASKELVATALPGNALTQKLVLKLAKAGARKALSAGARSTREAVQRALQAAGTAVDPDSSRRPPIQCSVDVAVPLRVAWSEWMKLEWLPEGVDQVRDIERGRRDKLRGRTVGSANSRWRADVLDEREEESFAWRSRGGSDCAGLITFHELGERLTRIELNLDVIPKTVGQAAVLSTRVADRRTQAAVRRFKARLELINPDLYEDR